MPITGRATTGARRLCGGTLRRPLDAAGERMPGRAIGVPGSPSTGRRKTLVGRLEAAAEDAAAHARCAFRSGSRAWPRARRRHRRRGRRCRHPQPDALQAAGARRLFLRPAPALGRDARPLRPADRRHAGHARRDPLRRRRRRRARRRARRRRSRSRSIPASSKVGPDGTAEVAFDIPAFNGTVRVMAVAWSKDKVGQRQRRRDRARSGGRDRDAAALPAHRRPVAACASTSTMSRAPPATTPSTLDVDGPLQRRRRRDAQTLQLAARQRSGVSHPGQRRAGRHRRPSTLRLTGPGNFDASAELHAGRQAGDPGALPPHRAAARPRREPDDLERSPRRLPARHRRGRARRSAPSAALDVPALLKALDRYPYGCTEQIVSRAMPLLYVNELAAEAHLALDDGGRPAHPRRHRPRAVAPGLERLVRPVVGRAARTSGSTPTSPTSSPGRASAASRCRDVAFRLALDRLRNQVANATESNKDCGARPRLCDLRAGPQRRRAIGDLRYLADTKLGDFARRSPGRRSPRRSPARRPGARRARLSAALDAIPEQPRAGLSAAPTMARALRDGAALVTLAAEGGGARPTIAQRGRAWSKRRAALTPYTSHPGERLAGAGGARAGQGRRSGVALDVDGEARTGPALPHLRGADARERAADGDQHRRCARCRRWSRSPARRSTPEPAADQGFKIERSYYTLDGEKADLAKAEPEPALRRGAEGHRAEAEVRPACCSSTTCRPGFEIDNPQPRLVRRHRHAVVARGRGASRSYPSSATTASSPRSSASDSDQAVFTVAYVVRAVSPGRYVHAAGLCRGHVPPRALRPHRLRHGRGRRRGEPMRPARHRSHRWLAAARRGGWRRAASVRVRRWALGPVPLGRTWTVRPWCSTATGGCCGPITTPDGRWRCRRPWPMSIRASSRCCSPTRTGASASHHGVDPLALAARRRGSRSRNGRIVSGGSTLTMQVARLLEPREERTLGRQAAQMVRAIAARAHAQQGRDPRLYLALAPYGGNLEGVRAASLAYFGKEPQPALAGAKRRCWWRCRSRRRRAGRIARPMAARKRARPRARPRWRRAAACRPTRSPSAKPSRCRPRGGRCRRSRRMPPTGGRGRAGAPRCIASPSTRVCRRSLEELARDAGRALGPDISVAIIVVDNATGEVLARVGVGGLFRRRARRPGRHDPGAALARLGAEAVHLRARLRGRLVHPETLIEDRPIRFGSYAPENFDLTFQGTVTARKALQLSLNVPAVACWIAVGPSRLIARLAQAGGAAGCCPRASRPASPSASAASA